MSVNNIPIAKLRNAQSNTYKYLDFLLFKLYFFFAKILLYFLITVKKLLMRLSYSLNLLYYFHQERKDNRKKSQWNNIDIKKKLINKVIKYKLTTKVL